jgi:hypothetical protein
MVVAVGGKGGTMHNAHNSPYEVFVEKKYDHDNVITV